MPKVSIVVSVTDDWKPYHAARAVNDVDSYLAAQRSRSANALILNLCRNYRYLSHGYYCSLLAESRGQTVLPSIRTINSLSNKSLYVLDLEPIKQVLSKLKLSHAHAASEPLKIKVFFGRTREPDLSALARTLFEQFPCPILELSIALAPEWSIKQVRMVGINTLTEDEETEFADALDQFSTKVWKQPRGQKQYAYDLAILVNPDEKLPPSDPRALKKFEKAAQDLGIGVKRITRRDFSKLAEYDGLFIRETTATNDHTYRFAKRAESQGSVVIDDPQSILRCTNKIYLANLMTVNNVPTPKSVVLNSHMKHRLSELVDSIAFPMVLKIPDGSFSRGVVKAQNMTELTSHAEDFFSRSALILAQEFFPTDYDWRIGVLNGEALFACQYFMSRGHWQIYKHGKNGQVSSGDFLTIPVEEAPELVISTAVRATQLIGNGLYGVDIKQRGDEVVVIEVNDNPNIDYGVEDKYLGDELYRKLAMSFRQQLDAIVGQ